MSKTDQWDNCFNPKMGLDEASFAAAFCARCANLSCVRSKGSQMRWARRMVEQERMLIDPQFADPNDPRYAAIRGLDFKSLVRDAIQLAASDKRNDWTVPKFQEALAEVVVPPPNPAVEATRKVLETFTIRGSKNEVYTVTLTTVGDIHAPSWECTCKDYRFRNHNCKHIVAAQVQFKNNMPALFQLEGEATPDGDNDPIVTPTPATVDMTIPELRGKVIFPPAPNTPNPGPVVIGPRTLIENKQGDPGTSTPKVDPWAVPPKTVAVGAVVRMGGGKEGDK